jgi:C4-dicarboxylate-specific signal transduction histidine kinase
MINEVLSVMSDVNTGAAFEITAGELCDDLRGRLEPFAARHGVQLEFAVADDSLLLAARTAGIGALVLANLAQNAIEASPKKNARVQVALASADSSGFVACRVSDQGGGLPDHVAADPFRPRSSTKPDGAGIGLAISRELARHAGGELSLERTGPEGTVFSLKLPAVMARVSPH